ncbi:MAG: glycosyltransferase [Deltaproteobacteria bacterium]|nr:glycosyltransferase [Deltaproteobacteria bacterium]
MNARRVQTKLARGTALEVLFLNDRGFQFGAGLAQLRQLQSFLARGHNATALCWRAGPPDALPVPPPGARGAWRGVIQLPDHSREQGKGREELRRVVVERAAGLDPDLIVVGNLHGAGWPLEILTDLAELDSLTVAYMHDCHFATARCAYPGDCRQFQSGCTPLCPTPREYPALAPDLIPAEWRLRQRLFNTPTGIPLAANSAWTLGLAQAAFPGLQNSAVLPYGLDETLFRPMDQALCRRLLGLPEAGLAVLFGAVNFSEVRKGWPIIQELMPQIAGEPLFLFFGAQTPEAPGRFSAGFLRDYRKMPLLYNAADLFVMTSLEEAFGQTILEAAACGKPVASFQLGGMPEVAVPGRNALGVTEISAAALARAVNRLVAEPALRAELGQAGRALVEEEFTLEAQGRRWEAYLAGLAL